MRVAPYVLLFFPLLAGVFAASNEMQQALITDKKESTFMIDFTEQHNLENWRITNDGVMGGKSQGHFSLQGDKAVFEGNISLDNNGGFSSVFRSIEPLSKGLKTVTINVLGDGLTYQLRMSVTLDGYRLAYKQHFNTVAGEQEKLTLILADFQASFRGRNIPNAPVLLAENIIEVGFLVTRKAAGPFSLAISSVAFK